MKLLSDVENFFSSERDKLSKHLGAYEKVDVIFSVYKDAKLSELVTNICLTFVNGVLSKAQCEDKPENGLYTVPFEAPGEIYEKIFVEKKLTLGEAMYDGMAICPEEKSKHNLVVATCQTIRELQNNRV